MEWVGKQGPELAKGDWINSPPLFLSELRGKVVLPEFWTFGCYNCRNTLSHLKEWHRKYTGAEFTIIGVHTPEFDREKNLRVLKREIARLGISFPILTDNDRMEPLQSAVLACHVPTG
jgi:thiol-disulfide isomerase/thioredoxin